MPKVTIWIRNEDYEKWKAIADVPEWLHEHLNGTSFTPTYVQDGKKVTVKLPKRNTPDLHKEIMEAYDIPRSVYGITASATYPTHLTEPLLDNIEPTITPPKDIA